MELLTDELVGLTKALARLQQLTKNVENLLENHLRQEKEKTLQLQEPVHSLKECLSILYLYYGLYISYFLFFHHNKTSTASSSTSTPNSRT